MAKLSFLGFSAVITSTGSSFLTMATGLSTDFRRGCCSVTCLGCSKQCSPCGLWRNISSVFVILETGFALQFTNFEILLLLPYTELRVFDFGYCGWAWYLLNISVFCAILYGKYWRTLPHISLICVWEQPVSCIRTFMEAVLPCGPIIYLKLDTSICLLRNWWTLWPRPSSVRMFSIWFFD